MPENDPIVVYVIVREELNMSVGKICAQVGHAIQNLLLRYWRSQVLDVKLHCLPQKEVDQLKIMSDWLAIGSRKVVLKANEKEWLELRQEFSDKDSVVIRDAGLTELGEPTDTVIALMPICKSLASKSIKKLSSLK